MAERPNVVDVAIGLNQYPVVQYLYLDTEPKRNSEDVGGWHFDKLGLGCAVVLEGDQFKFFTEDNLPELVTLLEAADCVAGFYVKRFDFRVIEGQGLSLERVKCVDLMDEIEKSLGHLVTLASVAKATLGIETVDNAMEVKAAKRRGDFGPASKSCCNDALAAKAIHEYGMVHGEVFFSARQTGNSVRVAVNW